MKEARPRASTRPRSEFVMRYSLSHLSDEGLLQSADAIHLREADSLAWMLSHLIEIEQRRAYAVAGCPSLRAYCTGRLKHTEDEAPARIRAARAAREFPLILELVGSGRLHLTAINLLAPHLRPDTAGELLVAACDKRRSEIELLLADRSPKPEVGEHAPDLGLASDQNDVVREPPADVPEAVPER